MAKKIKAEDAELGKFYVIRGKLCFCVADTFGVKGDYPFQEVGGNSRFGVVMEKIKPVNIYMFSK